ncbi:unnamed protein product [Linum trigynum]|uniref:Peptidase A1 domain-containing protein n=1 Tax=Linum trigynum TaxID=586398 RepID=A0AAV2GTN0_9ROSI
MEQLAAWDRARHARLFDGSVGGVVSFSLQGSAGVYLAPIKLGFPPKEFKVLIDTGSEVLWVKSNACANCPRYNRLGMPLNFFESAASSTAGSLSCSNQFCAAVARTAATHCVSHQCSYTIQYADGSGTSGLYMTDKFYLSSISPDSMVASSSALVVFGVSTYQSGALVDTYNEFDGIFGFGRGIVYTPLVPSQRHCNLYLQSIVVNGQMLPIDPVVFVTSTHHGTIVDSGTNMVYITEKAYDPLVNAVTSVVSHSATPRIHSGRQCYLIGSSVSHIFPLVSFSFVGGASLVIKPQEYLIVSDEGIGMWCLGFLKNNGQTILGELILKDKIFVYDMDNGRVGWVDYNCSLVTNISLSNKDFASPSQSNLSSSYRDLSLELWPPAIAALLCTCWVLLIVSY